MQDIIKRYFWVLGALVVMTCAIFAAKASKSTTPRGEFWIQLRQEPEDRPGQRAEPRRLRPRRVRSKDGTQLATRKMFCWTARRRLETVSKTDNAARSRTRRLPLVAAGDQRRALDFEGLVRDDDPHREPAPGRVRRR